MTTKQHKTTTGTQNYLKDKQTDKKMHNEYKEPKNYHKVYVSCSNVEELIGPFAYLCSGASNS